MPSTNNSLETDTKPVLGVYSHIYLEKAEKHVFRQIHNITAFEVHVFYQALRNVPLFGFQNLHSIMPGQNAFDLKRFWKKYVRKEPPFLYRGYVDLLLEEVRFWNVDVLHIYFGYYATEMLPAFHSLEIPVVVSFHGRDATACFQDERYAQKARQVFQEATLIFTRSDAMSRHLVEQGCPPEKIRVTRTPINLEKYSYQFNPYPQSGPVRFIQACRLLPKKGLQTAIKAFAQVHKRFPNTRLDIVGSGPLEANLQMLIDSLALNSAITLRGYLEGPDLIEALRQSHIFLHPSETAADGDEEGIPNAIIEAQALGLPVISTFHAGIPELIEHGKTGILVAEKDAKELASYMEKLLQNPQTWERFALAGHQAVTEKHEMKQQIARLESFYFEAMRLGKPQQIPSLPQR